jgi:hypothetical protein
MNWLPIVAAAKQLKVSTKTVQRAIKNGVYPSKLVGSLRYVMLQTPGNKQRNTTKNGRVYLLNIFFNSLELKTLCFEYFNAERVTGRLWDSLLSMEGRPREEDWKRLYLIIDAYCNGVEKRCKERSFDEDFFFKMYKDMRIIKGIWAQHTSWCSPDNMETEEKDLVDKEALAIIDKIRRDIEKLLLELT